MTLKTTGISDPIPNLNRLRAMLEEGGQLQSLKPSARHGNVCVAVYDAMYTVHFGQGPLWNIQVNLPEFGQCIFSDVTMQITLCFHVNFEVLISFLLEYLLHGERLLVWERIGPRVLSFQEAVWNTYIASTL